jgi:hypothetical protein
MLRASAAGKHDSETGVAPNTVKDSSFLLLLRVLGPKHCAASLAEPEQIVLCGRSR